MLHVRVTTPVGLTDNVVELAADSAGVAHVIVHRGAAVSPPGDLVEFDLAREAADGILLCLQELGLAERGSISVEHIDLSLSRAADAAEVAAPGYDDEAVVWDELDARTEADSRMSWVFLAFLALSTQLSAIAMLLDQTIILVGAMVLGPEFGALAAICLGMLTKNFRRVMDATKTFVAGFAISIAITALFALVSRWLGWIDAEMLTDRPNTEFITQPDKWSFIVAVLAGIAGTLSLTSGKSSALVGVFISVTTVPAAGYIAVAIALTQWDDVGKSATQLGVNVLGLLLAGVVTLLVQRLLWKKFGTSRPTLKRR